MRNRKVLVTLTAIVVAEVICIVGICARDDKVRPMPDVKIRRIGPQAVLYTVFRGHYEEIGPEINRLYNLAEAKGLIPVGPVATGYLNNPQFISPEHWLIEIRIPVDTDSLKYTGTLGQMTDIKLLPAMNVAASVKPKGQNDPGPAIRSLYAWINQRGYRVAGGLWQTVLCDESKDYAQMRTEFIIPIISQAVIN